MNSSINSSSTSSMRTGSSSNITNKTTSQPLPVDAEMKNTSEMNTELLRTILAHVIDGSKHMSEPTEPPTPATVELTKSIETNSELLRTILSQVTQLSSQFETLRPLNIRSTDNSDAFDICRRFEKLNWESIDIINKKIDNITVTDNPNHLDNIRSSLSDINQKISCIESTIASMHETPMPMSNLCYPSASYEDLTDCTTQQLSERFKALLSDDRGSCCLANTPIPDQFNDTPRPTPESDAVNLLATNNSTSSDDTLVDQPKKYEFYVTKFSTNTTSNMILDYMRKNGVQTTNSLKVSCLIPRSKDRSTLTFVSFKIDTENSTVAEIITNPGFWPNKCTIRTFSHKSVIDLSSQGNCHKSSNFFHHPGTNQKPM